MMLETVSVSLQVLSGSLPHAYRRWLQLRQRSFAKQQFSKADVAVGSKGDMSECPRSVRLVRPAGTIAISDWLVITG
jgi:hypothetical protein